MLFRSGGTYEGTITPATAVLNGLVGKDNPEITLTYTGKANDGTEVTVTVVPKEITVKITPNGGTYEGTITPATAVLNGLVGKDNPEITLTYTGKANDGTEVNGTEVPSLAGTYIVTATIKDKNYSLKPEGSSAEFVVAKADPALSVSEVTDKDYGEETFRDRKSVV